jgi:hypothetical protein
MSICHEMARLRAAPTGFLIHAKSLPQQPLSDQGRKPIHSSDTLDAGDQSAQTHPEEYRSAGSNEFRPVEAQA